MSTLKILHAADLHLDTPFGGLPEAKAKKRRAEQRSLLQRLVSLAVSERADAVLLSGDLLDSGSTFGETGEMLGRMINSMPCPVFISPGNHDYYCETSPYARIRDSARIHIFRSEKIECVELPEAGVRVFGAGYTDRIAGNLLRGFSADRLPGMLNIMCLHGEIAETGRYCPLSEKDIEESGMDYIAFGHVHSGSGLKFSGNTAWSWPGCPEGRGFDETGNKSVSIIEIDRDSRKAEISFRNIAQRRYFSLSVDISESDPLLAIHRFLPDDTENDIYRINLVGETDGAVDLSRLYRNLEGMFFHLELLDCTKFSRDIWDKIGEDTLRGIFLRKMRERFDAAQSQSEKELVEKAVRHGLAALDRREEPESDY